MFKISVRRCSSLLTRYNGKSEFINIEGISKEIHAFRGIPYAITKRFEDATSYEFHEDLPKIDFSPHYPQPDEFNKSNWKSLPRIIKESEVKYAHESDPLYMDIYTPSIKSKNLATVIYIHGGSLLIGGASSYDGIALSAVGDVVVVSINYRLGIFGTASFENDGNWCLSDVLHALKFVQKNITKFGGNPNNVTLMGYSVGGMMVDALMSSPLSSGLFHRAIAMSGSFASPWVANSRVEYCREKFMEVTATESTTELKKKLLSLSFSELRQVEMNAFISNPCFYFTLTVGDKIIPKNPYVDASAFKMNVPYLIGKTNHEGGYSMSFYHHPNFQTGLSKEEFSDLLVKTAVNRGFYVEGVSVQEDFVKHVIDAFGPEYNSSGPLYYSLIWGNWFGETEIGLGIEDQAETHTNDTFIYRNNARPLYASSEKHCGSLDPRPSSSKCDHGDCYIYLFGLPLYEKNSQGVIFTEEEKKCSMAMIKNWTHFMKTGKPHEQDWKPFKVSKERIEIFKDSKWEMKKQSESDFRKEKYFRNHIVPYLAK